MVDVEDDSINIQMKSSDVLKLCNVSIREQKCVGNLGTLLRCKTQKLTALVEHFMQCHLPYALFISVVCTPHTIHRLLHVSRAYFKFN